MTIRRTGKSASSQSRTQHGATGNARIRAIARGNYRHFMRAWINRELRNSLAEMIEKWTIQPCSAAADHDYIRVEQINHVAQPQCNHLHRLCEQFGRELIASSVGFAYDLARNCIWHPGGEFQHGRMSSAEKFFASAPYESC